MGTMWMALVLGREPFPIVHIAMRLPTKRNMTELPTRSSLQVNSPRIDVLRKSMMQMINHGGYRATDKTFCKQRHWISIYRIAADEGFTIDGDFWYFKHIIDGMKLPIEDISLKASTLEQTVKGVYANSFADWKSDGLSGRRLNEYNDIRHCAEVFAKILAENRPKIHGGARE